MTRILLFSSLLVFVVTACQDADQSDQILIPVQKEFPNVDEALWPYFSNFEEEAAKRNINVDLSRTTITGTIQSIHEDGIAGSCSYGGRQRENEVIIDSEFWNRASSLLKEYIIFHELGHCFLFRDHKEACLTNRTWASIMRSGTTSDCRDNYNSQTRDYYVDELFGLEDN